MTIRTNTKTTQFWREEMQHGLRTVAHVKERLTKAIGTTEALLPFDGKTLRTAGKDVSLRMDFLADKVEVTVDGKDLKTTPFTTTIPTQPEFSVSKNPLASQTPSIAAITIGMYSAVDYKAEGPFGNSIISEMGVLPTNPLVKLVVPPAVAGLEIAPLPNGNVQLTIRDNFGAVSEHKDVYEFGVG